MNPDRNPIATLLNLPIGRQTFIVGGRSYDLYPAHGDIVETLYRTNPGWGVSNPGFSMAFVPATHCAMVLGQYLAGRPGVKRAEAEAITAAARDELAGVAV